MALQELYLSDGTTTVALADSPTWPIQYTPEPPREGAQTVTESCEIAFSTLAIARSKVTTVNRLLEQAATYQRTRTGSRVFVYLESDTGDPLYRSEILSGRVEWDDRFFHEHMGANYAEALVIWTRRGFWEGPQTQIPLTNANGTDNTAGLIILNHNDAGATDDNFADIDADDVTGDLPAPLRLEMTNTTDPVDSTVATRKVYVALGVNNDPSNFAHIVEGEDIAGGATTYSVQVSSSVSGGEYGRFTWSGAGELSIAVITLSNTVLSQTKGNYFKVLAVLRVDPPAGMFYRLLLQDENSRIIWEGPLVYGVDAQRLIDLGSLPLPPSLGGANINMGELSLHINGGGTSVGSYTWDLDFLQLTPLDGFRAFDGDDSVAENELIIDDGIRGFAYRSDGTYAYTLSAPRGQPIEVVPGKDQRLYFLQGGGDGSAYFKREFTVKAYYRPRRVTL